MATVTFLFVDQVGSTAQLEALGDVAAAEVRDAYFRLLRAALAAHAGTEVDHTGDGVMATFTSAVDATSCAIAMQHGMHTHNLRHERDRALEIRIGIHTGEPVLNEEGRNFGLPVVVASRLCAAAQSGQILASDVTRVLAGAREHLHFRAVDALALKGFAEPVAAAEVVWDPPDAEAGRWPLPPMLVAVGDFAFVGREHELDALRAAWNRARNGERAAVLVAGEPGIGETRLAAELAGEVRAGGGRVLFGWCDDELGVPYQPFVEALRQFVAHAPPHTLSRELGRYAGDLVRLVPEIDGHDLPTALDSDPETERYRLLEAVASWLAAATREEPVLLVLDDLHWAAKPTLLMLQHLVRATEPARLLVLGTYRDTELGRTHPLAAVLADLRRGAGPERLGVAGLDADEVTAFLEAATGHDLDEQGRALAQVIHAETEGNAFFITEVVRHLAESGAVVQRDGRWTTDRAIADIGIPEGVREVVGRRLSRLSGATDEVLALAAVIGREYELGLLDAAGEQDEAALLAALDEAVTARLVDERAPGCYRFTHALVRSTLYDELRPTRRARLHRSVAEALERLDDGRVAELAYHYAQASIGGDTTKAVEYATRGDQALAELAHDEAAVFYARAIEMLPGAPDADLAQRCDLFLALGTAQRRAGDAAHKATLLEAARLAGELGDGERAARAALKNSRQWGWSVTGGIDHERVAALETALQMLGPGHDEMRARLLGHLSTELVFEEDPRRRFELSDEAVTVARRSGDPATLARVLHLRLVAVQGIAPRDERYALVSEALALASELSDPVLTGFPTVNRLALAVEDGDLAYADELLAAALPIAEDLHIPGMLWLVLNWLPVLATTRGAFDDAERGLNEAFVLGQAAEQPDALMLFASQVFCLRFLQGRVAELEQMAVQSVMEGIGPGGPAAECLLAVLYSELGRVAEARTAFEKNARDDFARFPAGYLNLALLAFSAETCARLGDAPRAQVLCALLEPHREPFVVAGPTCFGATSRYLGLVATTCGRFDEAEAAFAAASDLHEQAGARPWLARTQVDRARMLVARDGFGGSAARMLLEHAQQAAHELGMMSTDREATTMLAAIASG